jgi:hypothetical protein
MVNWIRVGLIAGGIGVLTIGTEVACMRSENESKRPSVALNKVANNAHDMFQWIGKQIAVISDIPSLIRKLVQLQLVQDICTATENVCGPTFGLLISPFSTLAGYVNEVSKRNWFMIICTTSLIVSGLIFADKTKVYQLLNQAKTLISSKQLSIAN